MAFCDQNHFHLDHILKKLAKSKKNNFFLKIIKEKILNKKHIIPPLPRCPGCAYVMGYKDGLNGTCSGCDNIPYRETETNTCPEEAYKQGFEDGTKERLLNS